METTETIRAWQRETFGPVRDPRHACDRVLEEVEELVAAIMDWDRNAIAEECADVLITLCAVPGAARFPELSLKGLRLIGDPNRRWSCPDLALEEAGWTTRAVVTIRSLLGNPLPAGFGGDLDVAFSGRWLDAALPIHVIASRLGYDLQREVDRKMEVNRARVWTPKGDGTGRHRS